MVCAESSVGAVAAPTAAGITPNMSGVKRKLAGDAHDDAGAEAGILGWWRTG